MNVLSLFDGMSCLQIALKEYGFVVDKYYASEIDKFAIKQTQHNFPDTIQLGSVTEWRTWDIDWSSIDLIGAGSPCQGFSFAGKQLAFDDPRSKLFFVFVEILNHCKKFNPEVRFLLENVDMKKDHLRIISEYVGIFPTNINSSLVSAQSRSRWYWTNFRTKKIGLFDELYTDIPQPIDKKIFLNDILQPESEVDEKYYLNDKQQEYLKENHSLYNREGNADKSQTLLKKYSYGICHQFIKIPEKSYCIDANYFKGASVEQYEKKKRRQIIVNDDFRVRKLTPIECARLQTIPDWYKWDCSTTHIYQMLGNGWTVKVIEHILSYL